MVIEPETQASDPDAPKRPSRRPQRRGGAAGRLAISSGLIVALVVTVFIVSVFAPDTPAPSSFFVTPTPAPLAPRKASVGPVTPLGLALREDAQTRYLNSLVSHMTLDEELGQMIMMGFSETQMDDSLAYQIQQLHVGSAILYAFNIKTTPQVKALVSGMQADATIPLLIATDQEGGMVNRMASIEGLTPTAAMIGATGDPSKAFQRGQADAAALAQVGINLDLAPVVDVLQTSGGDIQTRAFGSTPGVVTTMAGAYLNGLQQSGQVAGTLKHFPGLGDVPVDPHATLYTLTRSRPDLERIDWAPYRALFATGKVYAVMSTHIIVAAVDPTAPASLSQPVLTGILRDDLGFNGVVITDGIYMGSLAKYTLAQIAVDAIVAGNDIICSTYSIQSTEEIISVLRQAVASGKISKARIDASVRRILLLKIRLGLLPMPNFGAPLGG
ncbi:MAG TPA: glycoside hydrolase family 3 N-terminal domain-containing protein [Ktedonobacterales bacterium]